MQSLMYVALGESAPEEIIYFILNIPDMERPYDKTHYAFISYKVYYWRTSGPK